VTRYEKNLSVKLKVQIHIGSAQLSHKLLLENIEWAIFINNFKSTIHVKELSILHVSLELYNVRPTHLLNTNLAQ
jgi:HKD family nuclease